MTVTVRAQEIRRPALVRHVEFDRLTHLVRAARDRHGRVAELTGDPGAGKSWLLDGLAARARRDGVTVWSGRCSEAGADQPFHPFLQALAAWRGPGGRIVPAAATLIDVLGAAGDAGTASFTGRHQLFVTVRRGLADCLAAAPGDVLLLLDDVHWADPLSVALLEMLIRRPVDGPLTTVVAHRPRQSPVRLRSVLDLGGVASVALGPLSYGQSARLLDGLAPETLQGLHDDAMGNPLYLTALAGQHRDRPADDGGPWTRGSLGARLLAETEPLREEARLVLDAAAVLGDVVDVGAVAAVAGVDRDVACRVLTELRRRDLIRPVPGSPGTLTFRHPLVRLALYGAADPCWRSAAHGRAARHLSATGAPPAEVARHAERSGILSADPALLVAAVHDALRNGRPAEAAHWVGSALRVQRAHGAEPGPGLWRPVVRALAATGDAAGVRELARQVLGGPVGARSVAFLSSVTAALGDAGEAQALVLAELTARGDADPAARALLHVQAQLSTVLAGRTPARADVEALARDAAHEDRVTGAGRLALLGMCMVIGGHTARAAEPLRSAARLLDGAETPAGSREGGHLLVLAWAEALMGWYDQARAHAERALSGARERGEAHLMAPLLGTLGYVLFHMGRPADAHTVSLEARSVAHRIGRDDHVGLADALIAASWARLGRPTLPNGRDDDPAAARTPINALLFAEAALTGGEPGRALALLLPYEPEPGDLPEQVPEPVQVYAAWCYELLAAATLRADDGQHARVARWAEAAEDAAVAVGLPEAAGYARLAKGHVFAQARRWEPAARCYEDALALLGDGPPGGARARDLARAALHHLALGPQAGLGELTSREREVADLAGEGLKTKDIAERLRISPRTVDVHLNRIYAKLGVGSRAALVRLLSVSEPPGPGPR
ncbi:ATP-binding protein [Herbidospora cretacea]|uniref:ATP-binding protein n=1 Tax=Herbidospora cretacea TaxID=28444 RepID=UPI0004C41D48|nr:LuxR family transcriptional regulator [Herbidospora cretacea]